MKLVTNSEIISSLKHNKAAGSDDVDPEHIIFWGPSLARHLCLLFNAMLSATHIPAAFSHGIVIPISKTRNKDYSCPSNYRGITILSNLSKVLKKLILSKVLSQDCPSTLNILQGSFRTCHSCLHSAFVYQETVQLVRERNGMVFVAFLDVRKAFETVWHKGLMVKAYRKGIKGPVWKFLYRQMLLIFHQFSNLE